MKIWAQTDAPASVALRYWPDGKQRLARTTQPVAATPASAFAVEIDVIDLEPGTGYAYRVLIDGEPVPPVYEQRFQTQPLWQWRNDPPAFSFALGSCAYVNQREYDRPGQPYGGDYQVFDAIAVEQPDFMLWLGDNVYYREADWHSVSAMYARYSHTRQLHELQRLLSSTHHYATWDDHDYGPNDSDSSYRLREQALKIFGDFWPNPEFDSTAGGVTHHFEWHDAAFFMLDNRYFRQANGRVTGQRTVLGREQIGWLLDALKSSSASFKFVVMGGQFL
ncbi:MAG TPA: alkaline phosphatase D family protein, partial [Wenzhouxiangellaceae bacterium]|nr:alkaline phosphatase D family protein [Wenzhouxiangellaceae bacterium]